MFESVRTVYSFAAEEEEAKRYEKSLRETYNLQTCRDFVRALYLLVIKVIIPDVLLLRKLVNLLIGSDLSYQYNYSVIEITSRIFLLRKVFCFVLSIFF